MSKKVGRPKFEIDYDRVKDLSSVACTQEEIASILGCSLRTLTNDEKFKEVYEEGIANAKMSVRRGQFKLAMEGNATMLIWLGKQMLGQKEPKYEIETNNTIEDLSPLADLINKGLNEKDK